MNKIASVGIFGQGNFGKFVGTLLPSGVDTCYYDTRKASDTSFKQTVSADVIILAVPLQSYTSVLELLAPVVKPETLIIDVCSVKVLPEKLISKLLPEHKNILITHPLFGPQSATKSTENHQLIVTKSQGVKAEQVLKYCENGLKLKISYMTSEEHDKNMAEVHALTFFVARGLSLMNPQAGSFPTPSYQMILDMVAFDRSHTNELFETIELGNPYSEDVRQKYIATFTDLANNLKNDTTFDHE